ncbi:MAG TPA: isochorismatase family protein [Bryobacteraceae bacterium]|jgi:nicotinamidase-related amidase|nr:isochorismatase family protein [Bryobacteraceae bacterium]
MPLTQFDTAALVVIDLQKGIAGLPTAHPMADVVGRTAELARAFRKRGLPVVLVNATGMAPGRTDAGRPKYAFPPDWQELLPELEQQSGDHLVSKQRWGAFLGTELDRYLRDRGVTQIFLTGVATSAGVESTARSAFDLGYHVVLVTDAMTDMSAEAHRHSVDVIFPRIGETETSARVLEMIGNLPALD